MSNLLRVKQVVQQRIKRLGAARTGEFLSAAAHGDTQRVRAMLEQHLSPDVADYDGGRPARPLRCTALCLELRLRIGARSNPGPCSCTAAGCWSSPS
jgi:hypothetical protein